MRPPNGESHHELWQEVLQRHFQPSGSTVTLVFFSVSRASKHWLFAWMSLKSSIQREMSQWIKSFVQSGHEWEYSRAEVNIWCPSLFIWTDTLYSAGPPELPYATTLNLENTNNSILKNEDIWLVSDYWCCRFWPDQANINTFHKKTSYFLQFSER